MIPVEILVGLVVSALVLRALGELWLSLRGPLGR